MDPPDHLDADDIVRILGLRPHPEGGRFVETWRAPSSDEERASGTAIYFMLRTGEVSHWHRIDSAEIWHHYAGAPLALSTIDEAGAVHQQILGFRLDDGERPQVIVAPHQWQSARSLGDWTLVGCTVSPGFEFSEFELAPVDWVPGGTLDEPGTEPPR